VSIPAGGSVASASLSMTTFNVSRTDPSETIQFYDVSTPASVLTTNSAIGSSSGLAAYEDFGTGIVYGSQVYTNADSSATDRKSSR
jgi:hypothetical protein